MSLRCNSSPTCSSQRSCKCGEEKPKREATDADHAERTEAVKTYLATHE